MVVFFTSYALHKYKSLNLDSKPLVTKSVVGFAGCPYQWYLPSQEQAFMLSAQATKEFKELWKQEYGEEISDDFAIEQAINLLSVFDVIYQPIKKEWLEDSHI